MRKVPIASLLFAHVISFGLTGFHSMSLPFSILAYIIDTMLIQADPCISPATQKISIIRWID